VAGVLDAGLWAVAPGAPTPAADRARGRKAPASFCLAIFSDRITASLSRGGRVLMCDMLACAVHKVKPSPRLGMTGKRRHFSIARRAPFRQARPFCVEEQRVLVSIETSASRTAQQVLSQLGKKHLGASPPVMKVGGRDLDRLARSATTEKPLGRRQLLATLGFKRSRETERAPGARPSSHFS